MTRTPWQHSGKTTERGLGWDWQKRRLRVLRRDLHLCQPCQRAGRLTPATEVDHINPRHKAGTAVTDDGCEAICAACHETKTARDRGAKPRTSFDGQGRVIW